MPKKFTLLLSCLMLAVLAGSVSAGWWEGQTNWTAAVSNNWHDPCNWDNGVPDMLHWACVQGQVGDCNINAPAVTSRLSVACWPSGQPFMTLTISPNATLVDAGFALDIAAFTDGTYGVINMYGGKVINSDPTANATSGGLIIGGGDTGLRDVYGTMNMYAGEVNVPRISIPYGTLNLYGGLMDDRSTGASFTLGTRGKINVAGGTLKIKGDRTAPTGVLMVYINDGRVCGYDGRGDLSVTRDVPNNYTIVTAEPNYGRAWSPSPVNRSVDISFTPTLTWKPGEWVAYGAPNNGHHIYFGTDQNAVNNATVAIPLGVYVGRQDANSYSPAGPLGVGTTYYWRVDEANDANTPGLWKGQVW